MNRTCTHLHPAPYGFANGKMASHLLLDVPAPVRCSLRILRIGLARRAVPRTVDLRDACRGRVRFRAGVGGALLCLAGCLCTMQRSVVKADLMATLHRHVSGGQKVMLRCFQMQRSPD